MKRRGYPVWLYLNQRGHCLVHVPAPRKPRLRHVLRWNVVAGCSIGGVVGWLVQRWWFS